MDLYIVDPITGYHTSIYNATRTGADGWSFESSPVQLPDGSIIGSLFYAGPDGEGAVYRLTGFTIPPDSPPNTPNGPDGGNANLITYVSFMNYFIILVCILAVSFRLN